MIERCVSVCELKTRRLIGAMRDVGGISPIEPVFCNGGSWSMNLLMASRTILNLSQNCCRPWIEVSGIRALGSNNKFNKSPNRHYTLVKDGKLVRATR